MTILPSLEDLLPDFGGEGRRRAVVAAATFFPMAPQPPAPPEPCAAAEIAPSHPPLPPQIDMQEKIATEVADAESRIRQELGAAFEADLSLERERHERQLAEFQASFAAEAGKRIAEGWDEIAVQIAEITTGVTAKLLAPLLSDDVTRRSIDRLAATIRESLADREAVRFKIAGPGTLFASLKETLGPLAAQCDFTEAPGFDLNVAIEGSVIETRLAEWSAKINEAGL